MKFQFTILLLLIYSCCFSQNVPQDYVVTVENDTIYGYFHKEGFKEFYPKDEPYLKFRMHNFKKTKSFHRNGKKFERFDKKYDDGIYIDENNLKNIEDSLYHYEYEGTYYYKELKKPDYIVTISKDTIYGEIIDPLLIGKPYLIDKNGDKIKIKTKTVRAYQFKNKLMQSFPESRKKKKYYELITDGNIQLYKLEENDNQFVGVSTGVETGASTHRLQTKRTTFYLYDGQELQRIKSLRKSICKDLFQNNTEICNKIRRKELRIYNLPLLIEFYNNTRNDSN